MKFQESICKKDSQIPWFTELDAQAAPSSKKAKKGKAQSKDKVGKKKKQSGKKSSKKGKKKSINVDSFNQELEESKPTSKSKKSKTLNP